MAVHSVGDGPASARRADDDGRMDGGFWSRVRRGVVAAGDLVLPARCAACHAPHGPLCRRCSVALRAASHSGGAAVVRPHPPPPGMPPCWAGAPFDGVLRLAVTAHKDEGRRDLRDALAGPLATAVACALASDPVLRRRLALGEWVLVVPTPTSRSSRRRRGDDPVADLARAAAAQVRGSARAGGGLVVAGALAHTRPVADQTRLGRPAREANLAGSMTVTPAWRAVVTGAGCVLVDDVVTTGATLAEAARALRLAGAAHVVAATCATTPRRHPPPALWPIGPPTSVSA